MLLEAALAYARKGWKIIPLHWPTSDGGCSCRRPDCEHIGKHPRFKDWQALATTDEGTIRRWWREAPHANIGLPTGQINGLIVLDVDAGGADTIDAYGGFADTLWCQTSSGAHHYFAHPGGTIANRIKFLPGLDVRGDGGLVVVPPSRHASGTRYQWLSDPDRPLEPPPQWLLDALRQPTPAAATPGAPGTDSTLPPEPYPGPAHGGGSAYAQAALRREVEQLSRAPEGQRNDALNRAAFSLGTLVAAGELERTAVEAALEHAAQLAGLSAGETHRTLKSGLDAGIAKGTTHPRRIDPPRAPAAPAAVPPPDEDDGDEGTIDLLNRANRTDTGNAECLAALYGERLRYCRSRKKWLLWNGAHWGLDETGYVYRAMVEIARKRYLAAAQIESLEERKAAARWAITSESAGKVEAALKMASAWKPFASTIDQYDCNPWLAATPTDTLYLRTGSARSAMPTDYLTMALGASFDPQARCERWLQFLSEVFADDQELISFIQRAVGYSLTGDTSEQVFFLCYGSGANGKSVFLDILGDLLGDYAGSTAFDTFDAGKNPTATNDLAALKGKRFVSIIETEEDRRLAEARIKQVTGQDLVDCRFLYGEWFSYKPTYKIWMAMNHLPTIRGADRGIWRRIRLIPFTQSFEGNADKYLRDHLIQELPGILNWALAGLRAWLRDGLDTCQAVQVATAQYQRDSDQVGRWIDDCCVVEHHATTAIKDAYRSYQQWCQDCNERPLTQTMWGRRMSDKGFERSREGYARSYVGIGLLIPEEESPSHDAHDGFFETSPCEFRISESFKKRVMPVMAPGLDTPDDTAAPPGGQGEDALQRRAQQMVEEALERAARILADPRRSAEAARHCAFDVPGAYQQATLDRIEEMIAERLKEVTSGHP
jgi:putative DNA primase/helicase